MKKWFNSALNELSMFLKLSKPLGYPSQLLIEPTNFCNLRCPICATGSGKLTCKKGFMSWELFVNIIDDLAPFLKDVQLWGYGEPTLHPKIYEMIRYISSKNVSTTISSNFNKIRSLEAEHIVESGLKKIIIALDGASSETYKIYRIGGSFSKVVEGLEYLMAAKEKFQSVYPKVVIQFIVMSHNEHEIPEIIQFARKYGVKLKLKTAVVHEDTKSFLPQKSDIRRFNLSEKGTLIPKDTQPRVCPYAWNWATINWDGTVVPCCKDPLRDHLISEISAGNSFRMIWKSQTFQQFRKQFIADRTKLEKCSICVLPKNLM